MFGKIFKIIAASIALGAVIFIGTEVAMARVGGGGGHIGSGGGHFSGGAAHFGGGGGHFGGGGTHFGGVQFRSFGGGGAHFGGANVRRFGGAPIGLPRSGVAGGAHVRNFGGAHVRNFGGARVGTSRFVNISGARTLGGRTAWNRWAHHHHNHWKAGWNGGWGGWTYWPYFYGDLFAFAFWPYDYYDPFWVYGDYFVWDAIFWPGPDYTYYPEYFDVYGGPAGTRAARARNIDREITGSTTTTNRNDLAQTCSGLAPGVTDLPFDYIEQAIKPTDDQLKAFIALKAASSQASDALKASCSSEILLTPLGRLDTVQKRLDGMTQAVEIMRTPLDNFYNSLSEEQKRRFAALRPASDARTKRGKSASGNDPASLCNRRTENFTQLPVERIEQAIKPTQEQRDAFVRLKVASTEAANRLQASCPTPTPQTPLDRFDALAKRLDAMAEAIKIVRPELASFYASLTDEQKARFNLLGPPQTKTPPQG